MAQPDPIPVYLRDDWSWAFTLREPGGNEAPVNLTGSRVLGALYIPFRAEPIWLEPEAGQAGILDAEAGQLALGISRQDTDGITPTFRGLPAQAAVLHVHLDQDGLRSTIGVWPLTVLDGRDLQPAPAVNLVATDPVTGRTLTFDGPADAFPASGQGSLLSFDLFGTVL